MREQHASLITQRARGVIAWLFALGKRLLLIRPLHRDPPQSKFDVGLTAGIWLLSLVVLGLVGTHAPVISSDVIMFSVLATVSALFTVRLPSGLQITCSEIFYLTAFLVLPLEQAVAVILLSSLATVFVEDANLQEVVGSGGFMVGMYTAALLVAGFARQLDLPQWSLEAVLGTTIAMFVAMALVSSVMLWFIIFSDSGEARSPWARLTGTTAKVLAMLRENLVPGAIQVPMVAVGACAYQVNHAMPVLLLLPNLVAWHSAWQAQKLAEAKHQVGIDSLTGLANRGRFFELATAELAAANRYHHGLAVIMGDLDNFKRVNDTYGHLVGDEVLVSTANAFRSVIDEDIFPLARYGGEEFSIVLQVVVPGDIVAASERVRAMVERALSQWGTTISLGIAYLAPGDTVETLVDRADKALYSAKFAGKNRVHEWPRAAHSPRAAA